MSYTLTTNNTVVRDLDGAFIPNDPNNLDWQIYQGWLNQGNTPNPEPSTIPTIPNLIAYAANKRYTLETGGITLNGTSVSTSRDSQAMIDGAYTYITTSGASTISYKSDSGWITMDAATVKAVALAIGQHVQNCFTSEQAVDAAINAGTITTFAQIDSYNWTT